MTDLPDHPVFTRLDVDRSVATARATEALEGMDTWRACLGASTPPAKIAATISIDDVDHLDRLLTDLRHAVGQRDQAAAALDAAARLWNDTRSTP